MSEVLVLAGTGKTGRRVAARLAAAGHVARAAARTPGEAAPGVVPVRLAWDEPDTHGPALAGADAVYLVPPARRLDHPPLVRAFLERARAAGVGRVVLLSARGADAAGPENPLRAAELAVMGSGLAWTVLRPSWFAQNFSEDWLRDPIARDGVLPAPTGDGRTAFVDAEDIAAAAVAALTEDGHDGRGYVLTGPEALTWAEAAAVVGAAAGREVRHVDVDPAAWEAGAVAAGFSPAYAAVLGALFAGVRAGAEDGTAAGVREATGREPTPLAVVAAREAAAWRPQAVAGGAPAR